MRIVPRDVGGVVLKRVVAAWAVLSVVAGAAALYLELGRINRTVLGQARNEAKRYTEHLEAIGPQHLEALQARAREFLEGNFTSLRLFGADKKKILEVFEAGEPESHPRLPGHVHDLAAGEIDHHHMYWRNGHLLMQLLLPIAGTGGAERAYFEGVYEADAAALREMKTGLAASLALVLGAVLVTAAVLYSVIAALNRGVVSLSADLLKSNIELMEVLGSAIALRDSDTDTHNYRVTAYAIAMGCELGLGERALRDLIAGAFLHDIGKIGVSDAILLKPGPLTTSETEAMRRHVALGIGVVAKSAWLRGARDIVEYHHEKFDGSGYLQGLAGATIPLGARVFAIIDVFDALTSRRPYREPLSFGEAMAVLERGAGTHFDPAPLQAFRRVAPRAYRDIGAFEDAALRQTVRSQVAAHFRLADSTEGGAVGA